VLAVGDYTVPKLIEDSGGVIVGEFFDEGIRKYLWDVRTNDDPIRNIGTSFYLERDPPSIFQPSWRKRAEVIRRAAIDLNIEGVVFYLLSFEEIYNLEIPIVARSLEEINIPFLKLESSYEYAREAMAPLAARVEAFIESIKQKRRQAHE
jgi:benzoyl-CoA reductase/2-hydroxyglutaryl-CoA dehydratase subunit BcrC/BadD/HgdB